jgi:polysaccharide export outer membrane protein
MERKMSGLRSRTPKKSPGNARAGAWRFLDCVNQAPLGCRAIKLLLYGWLFAAVGLTQEPVPSNYVLGPDDQITLFVPDLEEINNKPMRIDMRGDLNMPLAGRVRAAGLTADKLETVIEGRIKKFVKDPEVVVNVTEFRSQAISVLGEVGSPGVRQLSGQKSLFKVLSEAGGLRPGAGNSVKITRNLKWGQIPLPNAKDDPTGQFSVASISSKSIMDATSPAENIAIKPDDVISVPKADLIYCMGSVKKPGGFVLGQEETLSALQVLSLAEGLDKSASADKAKIMRIVPGSTIRNEIPINLKRLMAGKAADLPLKSNDILFIPNSAAKSALSRSVEAAVQIGTGVAIYARY